MMKTARIYVFGDSLTYGAWDSQGGWCDRIKRRLHQMKNNTEYDIKFQMFNLGIGGENSRSLSNRFESELKNRHRVEWPAVIVVATGSNNTRFSELDQNPAISIEEFQENLKDIIETAKKYTDKLLFVGIAPVENDFQPFKKSLFSNEMLKKYDDVVTSVTNDYSVPKVAVWDAFKASTIRLYSVDGVHPKDEGHEIIEKLVWIELSKILLKNS
jgi:lysophospholipase L1-like esterase